MPGLVFRHFELCCLRKTTVAFAFNVEQLSRVCFKGVKGAALAHSFTYILEVVLPHFAPAYAIEGHVRGSMLPRGSEGVLGHLGETQVLGGRNNI